MNCILTFTFCQVSIYKDFILRFKLSNLSSRFKEVREAKRLTQEQFGNGLGISRAAVAAVEKGKSKVSYEVLCNLVEAYNVNLNYLLMGIGEPFIQINDIPEKLRNNIIEGIKEVLKNNGI